MWEDIREGIAYTAVYVGITFLLAMAAAFITAGVYVGWHTIGPGV